jgi:hypothetical protein
MWFQCFLHTRIDASASERLHLADDMLRIVESKMEMRTESHTKLLINGVEVATILAPKDLK